MRVVKAVFVTAALGDTLVLGGNETFAMSTIEPMSGVIIAGFILVELLQLALDLRPVQRIELPAVGIGCRSHYE